MRIFGLPLILVLLFGLSTLVLVSVAPELVNRHIVFGLVGLMTFFALARLSPVLLQKWAVAGYILSITLLVLVLLISTQTRSTARWIDLFGLVTIQPSQLAMTLCGWWFVQLCFRLKTKKLKHTLILVGSALLPAGLIFLQPDLGSTVAFLTPLLITIFLAGLPKKQIVILSVLALLMMAVAWQFGLKTYQKERLLVFISPGTGLAQPHYNARQALLAIGSGQIWGRGPGQGIQSQYQFLPEKHTDFIFAAYSEEYGLVGCVFLLALYSGLMIYLFNLARTNQDNAYGLWFGLLFAGLLVQTSINIGANLGLLPITGIPLPLFSSGGTALLGWFVALGIAQNRIWHSQARPFHIG